MINRTRSSMASVAIFALAAIGSGSLSRNRCRGDTSTAADLPPAVAAAVSATAPAPAAVVNADNSFGFRLLAQMRKSDAGKNVFISPVSIALSLDVLYNGAAGSTQKAMAKTLGIGFLSTADLNSGNANLQASLVSSNPSVQLIIANSFWYRKASNEILPSFINTNTKYYGSELGDMAGAPDNINGWVSANTNGKIKQIVDNEIRNSTATIVNAVYFKGAWASSFNPADTISSTFTIADGVSTVPCELMRKLGRFQYYKGEHFQAVQLPYRKPSYGNLQTTMLVFLPDVGVSVDSVICEINSASLMQWLAKFTQRPGSVSLPKFASTYTSNLKLVLATLGMGIAFDPRTANFSNMDSGLFVDTVIHKTYLSVDEFCTTAAAATVIGPSRGVQRAPEFTMTVNRPFVCAILDKQTGQILFYGAIDTPAV